MYILQLCILCGYLYICTQKTRTHTFPFSKPLSLTHTRTHSLSHANSHALIDRVRQRVQSRRTGGRGHPMAQIRVHYHISGQGCRQAAGELSVPSPLCPRLRKALAAKKHGIPPSHCFSLPAPALREEQTEMEGEQGAKSEMEGFARTFSRPSRKRGERASGTAHAS